MRGLAAVLVLALMAAKVAGAAPQSLGTKITLKETTSLQAAIADYEKFKDRELLASGKVAKVCQNRGCWMTVKTDADEVRVTFKDYGFFVPMDCVGKTARVQGKLERKETSIHEQQHRLKEERASKAAIDAVKAPKTEYSFVASGVELE